MRSFKIGSSEREFGGTLNKMGQKLIPSNDAPHPQANRLTRTDGIPYYHFLLPIMSTVSRGYRFVGTIAKTFFCGHSRQQYDVQQHKLEAWETYAAQPCLAVPWPIWAKFWVRGRG